MFSMSLIARIFRSPDEDEHENEEADGEFDKQEIDHK
jgi:hypothetical protein